MNKKPTLTTVANVVAAALRTDIPPTRGHALNVFTRLTKAEAQVTDMGLLVAAFSRQCEAVPAEDPLRKAVEHVLGAFMQVLSR
jgi:hypothetical protein